MKSVNKRHVDPIMCDCAIIDINWDRRGEAQREILKTRTIPHVSKKKEKKKIVVIIEKNRESENERECVRDERENNGHTQVNQD